MIYDIIIKNGKIIDGSGNPWYKADVGIKDGRISKIKRNLNEKVGREIDAERMIVCPGFIDTHSHSDFILPFFNKTESFVRQGITTCVVGMCGNSLAPIRPDKLEEFKENFSRTLPLFKTLNIPWNTFGEYLEKLEEKGCAINLACFVGYESLRLAGGAAHENRLPKQEELEKMKKYVAEAMEAGAFGMSTGLLYAPQVFTKKEELIELAKIVAQYNGFYFSHIRSECETVVEAVKEFIEIVEKSGCIGGQIAHHKVGGEKYWGASKETLRLIEEANSRGLSITCDSYPYSRALSSLVTALPPWTREGGPEKIMERLKNAEDRKHIRKDVEKGIEGWENWIRDDGFKNLYISMVNSEKWKAMKGKSISDITKIKGKKDDWETFFEILIDEKIGAYVTIETMGEEDIRRIMTSRYQMVGTDGAGMPYMPGFEAIHPRFFGTFPRVLGKYVREEKLLTLEDAIRRMTSFPAWRLGLEDRGLIRERNWADIVIFNPDTIIDKATYDQPQQFPEGIPHVIVNGVIVVDNNKQKNEYPGKLLRHSA